jgi:hypothetical protein
MIISLFWCDVIEHEAARCDGAKHNVVFLSLSMHAFQIQVRFATCRSDSHIGFKQTTALDTSIV